jgi:myo-inositol 2-dehydrogenase / D-chiro-inositol 1-dehydrogenase
MPVRTGVIGVGVMGAEHARLLSHVVSGSEVAGVFDLDGARAQRVAAGCGGSVFDDPMVLIKDDRIDAVLLASSDESHEQFVLACLAAGKPVLCEKPLAPDVDGCLRILRAESTVARRLLSVGFMRRYDPGYDDLKSALTEGGMGAPLLLHCVHRNAVGPPNQSSATLISGSAVHEIDITRWLLDEELVSVAVHRPRPSSASVDTQDPMLLVFASASGVLVDVEIFVNARYGYEVRCELVTENGSVQLDPTAPTTRRVAGQLAQAVPFDWRPRFAEAYRRELQDWVDGVATGDPARGASGWDGYVAAEVAEAGIRALQSGQTEPVILQEKPALYR